MKKTIFVAFLFLCMGFFAQSSYACSCITAESTEKDPQKAKESVRNFYLNTFKGAIFTGKVLNIEEVKNKIDETSYTLQRKVTIQVEKYWLGVEEPVMTIYTGIGGGDCGVNFETGKRYFFYPQYIGEKLEAGICEYSSKESMNADGKLAKSFDEILGEAKTFDKKKDH